MGKGRDFKHVVANKLRNSGRLNHLGSSARGEEIYDAQQRQKLERMLHRQQHPQIRSWRAPRGNG